MTLLVVGGLYRRIGTVYTHGSGSGLYTGAIEPNEMIVVLSTADHEGCVRILGQTGLVGKVWWYPEKWERLQSGE